jgi:cellulose synthase/poly-beta-1,6-N-acetylglucosamine synthase-like glycosyltransferase
MILPAVFWIALALVLHSYLLYPLIAISIGRRGKAQSGSLQPASNAHVPTVAIVVAAYNEERHIAQRILNLLALDYPPELLQIHVGSDGSSDGTVPLAQQHANHRVRIHAFPQRRGKASVLNDLLRQVDADIVVFTDANTSFAPDALRALVRHFESADIGAVSGELKLQRAGEGDNEDGSYWHIETALKMGESRIGGLLGANGGIYAIRRFLYAPLPADTIIDDFTIVMNVSARGWRTVFDPQAIAYEEAPAKIDAEFRRRIRIGAGNYQAFFRHPEYWSRASNIRRFTYISHKVLRWFTPHLLILAFVSSAAMLDHPFYRTVFYLQLTGYVLLGGAMWLRSKLDLPRLLNAPLFVFALNVAFLIGFWRFASSNVSGDWQRTERT